VAFITLFLFMPDTPHFHMTRNNPVKATNALVYLRSYSHDISSELEQIETDVAESMNHSNGFLNVFKGRANLLGKCSILKILIN
jgi:hypothetical protein